jgi:hypothetical protein
MLARLKILPVRPAGLECFAQAPRHFAWRPEEDGRVLEVLNGVRLKGAVFFSWRSQSCGGSRRPIVAT